MITEKKIFVDTDTVIDFALDIASGVSHFFLTSSLQKLTGGSSKHHKLHDKDN